MSLAVPHVKTEVRAHSWQREENDWYTENKWVSERLFDRVQFIGSIHDPCCGSGRIVRAARAAGYIASGTDLVARGYGGGGVDFLADETPRQSIVCNPPFEKLEEFARHACKVITHRAAMISPVPSLNAAGKWLQDLPLHSVWLLTPRPSMPPGHVVLDLERQGREPSGGKKDFCWLIFERGFEGAPSIRWLHRDKEKQR